MGILSNMKQFIDEFPNKIRKDRKLIENDHLTILQLKCIMPMLSNTYATVYIQPLNNAMHEFNINTSLRKAAFLAQLAHESGELRYFEELGSGVLYEGRKDLGNIYPGDGPRYKGRGPIQLTGRKNYVEYGKILGLDLENNPHLASHYNIGFRIAGCYWDMHVLNSFADVKDIKTITKKINGRLNGYEDRLKYYKKACEVFKI